jgi:hypothetical protein
MFDKIYQCSIADDDIHHQISSSSQFPDGPQGDSGRYDREQGVHRMRRIQHQQDTFCLPGFENQLCAHDYKWWHQQLNPPNH